MHQTETGYALTGSHISVTCLNCHVDNNFNVTSDCYSCHQQDYESTRNTEVDHIAQNFPTTCETCHNTTTWSDATFDHDATNFPLTGAHTEATCNDCHSSGIYAGLPTDCASCHIDQYNSVANPPHAEAGFAADNCESCHTTDAFTPSTWNHTQETNFTIDGSHVSLTCNECHDGTFINYQPDGTTECVTCHRADYDNASIHQQFGFGTNCIDCHNTTTFSDAEFDHDGRYFPIYSGRHQGLWNNDCSTCHTDPNDQSVFTCLSSGCHSNSSELQSQHSEVSGYVYESSACYACHPTGNSGDSFDHATTGFPLEGQHQVITCDQCHVNGDFQTPLDPTCVNCHQDNYNQTSNPNHSDAGFSTDCVQCHTAETFTTSTWDHANETGFALTGGHAAPTCNSCHDIINYNSSDVSCVSCHLDDYNSTTDPNHSQSGFSTNCENCHNSTSDWSDAEFDHDSRYFPIYSGRHQGLWNNDCSTCHTDPNDQSVFSCLSSGCHSNSSELQSQHSEVSSYVYESSACYACHPTGSSGDSFDHATTGFPLEGQHQVITCDQCHVNGDFQTQLDPTCVSCHQDNYDQTSNPNHSDAGFGTDCLLCHTAESFTTTTWDHSNETGFALTSGHASSSCNDCHDIIHYNSTSVSCASCHQEDYAQTTNPNHSDAGFSNVCAQCHTTDTFTTSTWNHNSETGFALTGGHATPSCNTCHDVISYSSTNVTCVSCHLSDYNSTTDPNHSQAGFPTTCADCHTSTSDWGDANFDHDQLYFPIYSGRHQGRWTTCTAECHIVPDNYANFSCGLNGICHEHDQSRMVSAHNEVSSFSYNASACYNCHPDGRAEDKLIPQNIIDKKQRHGLDNLENHR